MDQNKGDTNEKLLKNLADFMAEGHALGSEQERLDDEIRAAGIDPDAYVAKFKNLVEARILGHRAEIHQERVGAGVKMKMQTGRIRQKLLGMTPTERTALAARLEPRLAAYFRNFTSVSNEDKIGMLEDAELLDKLDEFIKGEEK